MDRSCLLNIQAFQTVSTIQWSPLYFHLRPSVIARPNMLGWNCEYYNNNSFISYQAFLLFSFQFFVVFMIGGRSRQVLLIYMIWYKYLYKYKFSHILIQLIINSSVYYFLSVILNLTNYTNINSFTY